MRRAGVSPASVGRASRLPDNLVTGLRPGNAPVEDPASRLESAKNLLHSDEKLCYAGFCDGRIAQLVRAPR
jgi:hypothetical protein